MSFRRSIMAGVAVVAISAFSSAAVAQCLAGAAVAPSAAISSFQDNPGALLSGNPDGGVSLSRAVRGLVGSDIDTLSAVMALLDEASPAQRSAIGVGLGQAAQACVAQAFDDPDAIEFAEMIQLSVAEAGYADVASAFTTVSNGIMTAAPAAPPTETPPGPGADAPGLGGVGPGAGPGTGVGGGVGPGPAPIASARAPSFVSPGGGTVPRSASPFR